MATLFLSLTGIDFSGLYALGEPYACFTSPDAYGSHTYVQDPFFLWFSKENSKGGSTGHMIII